MDRQVTTAISLVLLITVLFCYIFKPDSCAALTFFPPWAWGLLGMALASFTALYKKHILIITITSWLIFIAIFAEEPKSLLRGCFISNNNWHRIQNEKRVTIISLNCAGGNMNAVREILPYKPDIVLLQEVPIDIEDLESFSQELFKGDAAIAYEPDTAIIVRGELKQIPLQRPKNMFMTQAHIKLKSGYETEVICIRLQPPAIETNLLSTDCWINHRKDRISRRKQVAQIVEQINKIPNKLPIILGGDFNVPANDGCLKMLHFRLKDTFTKGGVGWGHTAINTVPLFRVDQIWASPHFKPVSVFSRKTKHSDHRMVICHVTIQ